MGHEIPMETGAWGVRVQWGLEHGSSYLPPEAPNFYFQAYYNWAEAYLQRPMIQETVLWIGVVRHVWVINTFVIKFRVLLSTRLRVDMA